MLLLEAAPREWRGGTSRTRNLRCMHDAPQDVLTGAYSEDEFWRDLQNVTGGLTNEALARIVIRESSRCRSGCAGTASTSSRRSRARCTFARTNAFFMGGGKALVNAYYRSAETLGVDVRYDSPVDALDLEDGRFVAARIGALRIEARACVVAAGGFESNRAWLREAWGQNAAANGPPTTS